MGQGPATGVTNLRVNQPPIVPVRIIVFFIIGNNRYPISYSHDGEIVMDVYSE